VSKAAGLDMPGLVIDLDASIAACHCDKENGASAWKTTFGFYPLFAFAITLMKR